MIPGSWLFSADPNQYDCPFIGSPRYNYIVRLAGVTKAQPRVTVTVLKHLSLPGRVSRLLLPSPPPSDI